MAKRRHLPSRPPPSVAGPTPSAVLPPSSTPALKRWRAIPTAACRRSLAAQASSERPSTSTFRHVRALLDAVMEHATAQVVEAMRGAEPQRGDPVEALERVLRATWRQLAQFHGILALNTARLSAEELHRRHVPMLDQPSPRSQSGRARRLALWHVVIVEDPHCRTACPIREPGYGGSRDRLLVGDEVRGECPHELLPVASLGDKHRAIVDRYSSQVQGRGVRALLQLVSQPLPGGTIPTGARSSPVVLLRAGSTAEGIAHPHGDLGQPSTADGAPCRCRRSQLTCSWATRVHDPEYLQGRLHGRLLDQAAVCSAPGMNRTCSPRTHPTDG